MGKTVLCVILIFLLFSCGSKEKNNVPAVPIAEVVVDTVVHVEDSGFVAEEAPETVLPVVRENEAFDDFIFHFASDSSFQSERVLFPLPYYKESIPLKVERENWRIDSSFFKQDYYSLLLDGENDLDLLGDTARTSIQVEWIYMESKMMEKFYFERIDGKWMLEAVDYRPIEKGMNRDFIDFFVRFSNDSLFQCQHIHEPLEFITTDPDDDFTIIETTLDPNQWLAFKPVLPKEVLSNINYGQKNDRKSQHKIIQLKGIGNGFINTLFFRRKNNTWEFYKFEDTSN